MRKPIVALIAATTFLVATGNAFAVTIQTIDTSHPWQEWADASQAPTWSGTLPLGATPGYVSCGGYTDAEGCTSITPAVDRTTGQIIQGPPAEISTEIDSSNDARVTFLHELGQVFWAEYMTPADETRFMQIVGLAGDSSNWSNWAYTRVVNGVTITFPPFEWFAEGYRYCATYGINQPLGVNDEEGLAYPGDKASFAAQQRQVCELIDQIGVESGLATPTQTSYPRPQRPVHATKATHPHLRKRIRLSWGRRRVW